MRPWNRAHKEMLDWQRDVWHIPEFFELLTQQQQEFDKAITGQISAKQALDTRGGIPGPHPAGCRPHQIVSKLRAGPAAMPAPTHPETKRGNDGGMATTDIIRTEVRREGGFLAWIMAPERRGPLLVTPAIIVLFLMNIFPLLWSFGLSFFNYRANRQTVPTFEGLANYGRVLTDPVIWERFQTTALIVGSSVLLQLVVGLPAGAAVRAAVPAAASSADAGADADDALAGRGRRVLQALL